MITATYRYYVDWDNDGDFSEDVEEISAYVMPAFWELYGGDSGNKTGTCRLTLDNSSSIFSSYNPSSPIGLILPNRLVRITMTIGAGSEVTMWQGKLQSIIPTVGLPVSISTAELIAYGGFDGMSKAEVHLAMQTDKTTGYNAALVLAAADPAIDTSAIDTGLSTMARYWINRKTNALEALRELEAAEAGLLRETKDGKIAFESRAHRTLVPHNTAQATYGTGTLNIWRLQQQDHLKGIYNSVEAAVRTFNETEDLVLATVVDVRNGLGTIPPSIAAGATRVITIEYPAADGSSQYPAVKTWGIVDIEANTAIDASGTDITNSSPGGLALSRIEYADRIEISITNNNAVTAYLITLRVHGTAVAEGTPIPVKAQDDAVGGSIELYGKRSYPNPSTWLTDLTEGQDYCDHILAMNKDPRPRISFDLEANYDANHLAEAQVRDISDRIHVTAGAIFGLYLDDDFFVEYMSHTVDQGRKHTVRMECSAVTAHSWPASGTSYNSKILASGIPDDLYVGSIDPSLHCLFSAGAWKYNQNITGARFRAKYFATRQEGSVDLQTVPEGGTLAHDGSTSFVVDDLIANQYGAQYELDSAAPGFWYFAFQFKSSAGDSVWSDGNKTPLYVTDNLPAEQIAAVGPPADWWVEVEPDADGHRVRVRAARPKTNGEKIWKWYVQIKDNRTGQWYEMNADPYPSSSIDVHYGCINTPPFIGEINHNLSLDGRRLTRASGVGLLPDSGPTIKVGDLILFDRRGSDWDLEYCQWATVDTIQGLKSGYNLATATYFDVVGRLRSDVISNLRLLAVNAPWDWTDEGFLGDQPNKGFWQEDFWTEGKHGDTTTEVFVSGWIDVPASVPLSAIEARVWFDNGYSVSDGGLITGGIVGDTGNPSGASGLQILTHDDDSAIPAGQIALQFNRETANYKSIYNVAAWFSTSLPAQGPYDVERDLSPSLILETGTCTVVKGNKSITAVRVQASPPNSIVGKVLLIFGSGSPPVTDDSDLDGNVIAAEGPGEIISTRGFGKSGNFSYAVIQPWWDRAGGFTTNLAYVWWQPEQCAGDIEQSVWRTPCFQPPPGNFYVTLSVRNSFGVGTRLTAGPSSGVVGCMALSVVGGEVTTDALRGNVFTIDSDSDYTLKNPTNAVVCGQPILWILTGTGDVTLDTKFNLMDGEAIERSSSRDMLGAIYNAVDDKWDCIYKKGA